MASAVYFRTSWRHNRAQRFREQKHRRNDLSGPQRFPYNVMQIMQGSFKYFQVLTHVQTARESPDLNMDFRSFDNGCKQLNE